jgi:hypothetical protein
MTTHFSVESLTKHSQSAKVNECWYSFHECDNEKYSPMIVISTILVCEMILLNYR